MRSLVITELLPDDPARQVYGAHRRLDMLIGGCTRLGQVDVLIYVHEHTDISPTAVERIRRRLSAHWRTEVGLFLCPMLSSFRGLPHPTQLSLIARALVHGALSYVALTLRPRTTGRPQVEALRGPLARRPDVIVAHKIGAMAPLLLTSEPTPPIVFDMDDVEHVKLTRALRRHPSPAAVLRYTLTYPLLVWSAFRALRRATVSLVCSETDRRALQAWWGVRGVEVLPNAVEAHAALPIPAAPTLLFLGYFPYPPNRDAAAYLLAEIWPLVRAAVPDARLMLAGDGPEHVAGFAAPPPGVTFPGFVEDLDSLYREVRVVAVPVFVAGGTRIKIIEAAAYGRPVVATTLGAEGLAFEPEREILLRDDPKAFADACIGLLRDDAACAALASRARERVRALYDRETVVKNLSERIRAAALAGPRT